VGATLGLRAAWAQLSEAVAQLKSEDPFASVTIVTPGYFGARDVLHRLVRDQSERQGLLNVRAFPAVELAHLLVRGHTDFASRAEVNNVVREGAIRGVLAKDAGVFGALAESRHTIRALATSLATLDGVTIPDAVLGQSALTDDVLRIDRGVKNSLAKDYFTPEELFRYGSTIFAEKGGVGHDLGYIIVFLPVRAKTAAERLFGEQLSQLAWATILWPAGPITTEVESGLLESATIVSASNPDDEARAIARMVVARLDTGLAGHRVAVLLSAEDPYRVLVQRYLDEAGVAVAGKSSRQLRDHSMVRHLLDLLGQPHSEQQGPIPVLNALASGALVCRNKKVPSLATLERVFRRLRFGSDEEHGADSDIDVDEYDDAIKRDLIVRDVFMDYLADLGRDIRHVQYSPTWAEAVQRLSSFIGLHFRPRKTRMAVRDLHGVSLRDWYDELLVSVDRLSGLDSASPPPNSDSIVDELEQVFSSASRNREKVGQGVFVGSIADGVARDTDVVIVCGIAEGFAPPRFSPDPLLPEEFVAELGGVVPTARELIRDQREQFFRALMSADTEVIVTYPRGDLRGSGDRVPSRWLASRLTESGHVSDLVEVASLYEGLVYGSPEQDGPIATSRERRLREVAAQTPVTFSEQDKVRYPHEVDFLHSGQMIRDRLDGIFSRFNGNLTSRADRGLLPDRALSPTSVERYATAPLSFFLHDILRATPLDPLVLSSEMDALNRGTLVHDTLEKWVNAREAGGPSDLDSLEEILRHEAKILKKNYGTFWVDLFYQRAIDALVEELSGWHAEHLARLARGLTVVGTEMAFGDDHALQPAMAKRKVAITLPDGTAVSFSGKIDRIDQLPGAGLEVIDYKTGNKKYLKDLETNPPTDSRKKFQLGIYGLLARQLALELPQDNHPIASYWFTQESGGAEAGERSECYVTITLSESDFETLTDDLSAVVELIRDGYFPPKPADSPFDPYTKLQGKETLELLWGKIRADSDVAPLLEVFDTGEDKQS
jgi:hypothetical protein